MFVKLSVISQDNDESLEAINRNNALKETVTLDRIKGWIEGCEKCKHDQYNMKTNVCI